LDFGAVRVKAGIAENKTSRSAHLTAVMNFAPEFTRARESTPTLSF
jgi:hypothetical protein